MPLGRDRRHEFVFSHLGTGRGGRTRPGAYQFPTLNSSSVPYVLKSRQSSIAGAKIVHADQSFWIPGGGWRFEGWKPARRPSSTADSRVVGFGGAFGRTPLMRRTRLRIRGRPRGRCRRRGGGRASPSPRGRCRRRGRRWRRRRRGICADPRRGRTFAPRRAARTSGSGRTPRRSSACGRSGRPPARPRRRPRRRSAAAARRRAPLLQRDRSRRRRPRAFPDPARRPGLRAEPARRGRRAAYQFPTLDSVIIPCALVVRFRCICGTKIVHATRNLRIPRSGCRFDLWNSALRPRIRGLSGSAERSATRQQAAIGQNAESSVPC